MCWSKWPPVQGQRMTSMPAWSIAVRMLRQRRSRSSRLKRGYSGSAIVSPPLRVGEDGGGALGDPARVVVQADLEPHVVRVVDFEGAGVLVQLHRPIRPDAIGSQRRQQLF